MSFFVPSLTKFNIYLNLLTDEGLKELKKLLIASCKQNLEDYFQLIEREFKEVCEILEIWYELKEDELAELNGDKKKSNMDYQDMLNLGFTEAQLMEGIN